MRQLEHCPERNQVRLPVTLGSGATYGEVGELEAVWMEKLRSPVRGLARKLRRGPSPIR